ncbi:L,D-transpeptidase family protein [Streptomyces xanthophaeus]|uniref:Murein L,D-transpeptidase n=1 Tax=Streptomyces xanthophaeus TaxID=67385 RepID=A0A919LE58_9ACTN|nr:L,D-transpeptidase family protein [Streptomyces xanthophaeus]WST24771.1 L,D-transpeptidase family protein [Streptomyces xanthophaeus]WST60257.1 L,D-transpeptidase family protein [Streptomyces xanthophaeus]GHI87291.1 murein L,D-transpeptidase [Streptomyces xanthophaeus]
MAAREEWVTTGAGSARGPRRALRAPGALTVLAAVLCLALPAPAAAAPGARAPEEPCTAGTGPYQRELEAHLGRTADGVQSPADCAAVRVFQKAHGIEPADGYPGLATYRTMVAVAARAEPNAAGGCPVRSYRVTCVDMERQLLWVQAGRRIVFPPVPVRTGRDDQETRPGWHEVYWRSIDHKSTLYDDAPMPYAQFFDGGQALHGRPGDLYAHGGSAGCVNLSVPDAERLWNLLTEGDAVFVWGTKPGTDD